MAMLQVPFVMQSHCPSSEAFESSKLVSTSRGKCGERRVTSDSQKFDYKRKTIYGQSVRSTSHEHHHVLKALAISDLSFLETSEKEATYRFRTEFGCQVKVLVTKKNNDGYVVYVEVESLHLSKEHKELTMVWGQFRSDSTSFMKSEDSQESNNTIETPFKKDSVGRLFVELPFDENLAPFYISILLKSQLGSDSKPSIIRSHRKTNFVVPVGFGSGRPYPLGISFLDDGYINFAFFSRSAESVVLCLYKDNTVEKPALELDLDPYVNRSGDIWHVLLENSKSFTSYGYRCKTGTDKKDHRVLLDPYSKIIEEFGSGLSRKYLGKLCEESAFDWSGEFRPNIPMEKLIVYGLNVTRFTKDKSSKLPGDISGSFSGISEKLHHFKDLGVNAVLLEPVFPFDDQKGPYFPFHFFSPGSLHGPSGNPKTVAKSMKEMVKKLHANGIEVLMEVVFTHTSEFGALQGIDDSCYYHFEKAEDLKKSRNNALNCNYPIVQQMILESLRYWVTEFHIDGFCFVNASSLTRGFHGEFLSRPPLVESISFDPLLSKVKIIADSWGPHEITEAKETAFPHWKRWAEMNTKFYTDVRNFLRGRGPISDLATRLCGSGDLFLAGRGPAFSFNFITRNVGLTLVDLVSFSGSTKLEKEELSWNCGEEGPTNKTVVLEKRLKQIRNFLFILFISLGVPVINMGDECGQSCGGSLEYADRKLLDWNALKSSFGVQVTEFISFLSSLKIRRSDLLQNRSFLKEDSIEWRGTDQSTPMWDDPSCRFLAMTLKVDEKSSRSKSDSMYVGGDLFLAFNSGNRLEKVTLPPLEVGETWVCLVDTALPFPGFFTVDGVPVEVGVETYDMKSHSCLLFEARSS